MEERGRSVADKTAHYNRARSWHSRRALWKTHQHPIPHPGKAASGEEGEGTISTSGAVLSTRVPALRYFGQNSVSLEMHQVGGKGELF